LGFSLEGSDLAGITKRVSLGLVVALLGVSMASMLVPTATSADTNLIIGQQAVISYANGDQVRLRETPDYEGTLIAMYDEGTYVTVLDGPLTDAAGNYWYQVSVGPNVGYIVADFLALENGAPLEAVAEATEEPVVEEAPVDVPVADVPTETDPVAVVPEAPVAGAVIAFGWVAGTNGDGVRCRAAADPNAPVITVLPEGTQIEITGPAFDIWQPINCMGGGGFVASQFVTTTDPNQAPVVTNPDGSTVEETPVAETPIAETPVASETPVTTNPDGSVATETPVASETPVATETAVAEEPTEVVDESAEPVILDESLVSGSAIVTGTNGDGVRCRARASSTSNTITIVSEGTSVQLTGVPTGVWQPVFCNGSAGYISNTYLGSGDSVSSTDGGAVSSTDGVTQLSVGADVSAAALTGTAVVSGTNGDGVRCRSSASTSGSIIMVVTEGTSLSLRGIATGDWQPVVCGGSNGFVFATYLRNSGSTSDGSTSGESSTDIGSSATTGTATVNSAPGGLNCRSTASLSGLVITVLSHGSTVSLRGASSNGWQPVVCAGRNGFASAQYISYGGTSGGGTSGGGTSGGGTSDGGATSGSTMYVSGTGGGGVRLRSSASLSGSILGVVPEGASVTVRNGSTSSWTAVTYNGTNGFISATYLARNGSSDGGGTSGGGSNNGGSTSGLVNGDHAAASDALNLRYSASYSAGVAAVAPAGTVVLITGAATNGFHPVDWDGLKGFMASQYLTETTAALSERGGSGDGGTNNGGTPGGSNSGGASGNSLVSYAMRYLGYPYVWATHGPSSFDCSGFTYWVVLNVLGRDIGAGTWTQVSAGSSVSRSSLQPGDLVFFQNTYTTGLSHVGMYIGNNQFIHAQNESTGVVISDLNSSYYSSRWYGAVRL
jgi:cell wall-associated NlpC family hydrolase